jgi:hypothetical protein
MKVKLFIKPIILLALLFVPFQQLYSEDAGLLKTEKTYLFYEYEITITQHKRISRPKASPYICRATIQISKKGKQLKRIEWPDIDAVGWYYGVFLPKSQESKNHFMMFKYGDYDSRTIILTKEGQIFNFGGGDYKIINKKYLITNHHQDDVRGLTIFDLQNNEVVLTTDFDMGYAYLYLQNSNMYIKLEKFIWTDSKSRKVTTYHKVDVDKKRMYQISENEDIFSQENIIKADLTNINLKSDCECY